MQDSQERLRARRVGIGWGHFIGQMVSVLEQEPRRHGPVQTICPLLGSAGIPIRNYHSNENVRLLAERLGAEPYFLNLPALAQSWEERELLCSTQLYRQTHLQWEQMDTALVNIGNYPSTPDFGPAGGCSTTTLIRRARSSPPTGTLPSRSPARFCPAVPG